MGQSGLPDGARALAHAGVGCAAAAANGKDCAAGAIGAAGASLFNPVLDEAIGGADGSGWGDNPALRTATLQLSSMAVTGALASALGKDGMTAALAAQNETVNNYLSPKQIAQADKAKDACAGEPRCEAKVRDSARILSAGQDFDLVTAKILCTFGSCGRYDQIVATLKPLYDPQQVVQDVATLHPDWTQEQVKTQAIAYLTEAQKSLNAATWRTVFGTLDVVGAVASVAGVGAVTGGAKGGAAVADDVTTAAKGEATVYRVFGGDARAQGFSWTTKDPRTVSNFRDAAGLPSGGPSGATNTADFLIIGRVKTSDVIKSRSALPLDGNKGGLPELIIDPKNVRITDFSVLKP